MLVLSNHSAAANSAIALVLQIGDQWRGVVVNNQTAGHELRSSEGDRLPVGFAQAIRCHG